LGDSQTGSSGVVCQVCRKTWPEDHSICPDDGTWLHDQTIMEIKPRSRRNSLPEFGGLELTEKQSPEVSEPLKKRHITQTGIGALNAAIRSTKALDITTGTQIGEYEVEAKIGEGAMGTVYRAIHPAIHKRVAIKVMTPKLFDEPESVKRFVAEARAVAAIEHPGIVDVFGFGRIPDGRTYLVMEWLDGKSLGAHMQEGPLPFLEVCQIMRQIARALEAAHAKSIVHRDLKPENVFIQRVDDEPPLIKLLDFGLAKTTNKEDALVAKTKTGQLLGTPLYMSPEQCKSKGVDHRTDIYALGCMGYEMLLGRTPFEADNVAELISAHLVGEPPRPSSLKPDLPAELDKLLFNMLAKDPHKRPPLGEVRRVFGMQLSRESNVALTPPGGYGALTPPVGFPRIPAPDVSSNDASVPPPPALTPTARPTAAELAVTKTPRWPLYGGLALAVIALVVLVLVLR
jgi:serine/threonine protein kinase